MTRILHIGHDEPTFLQNDERLVVYHPIPDSLTAYISRTTAIREFDHIVFNLCNTDYSQPHIISAFQMLKQFSSAEVTVIKEKNPETDSLFLTLQSFDFRNLVSYHEGDIGKMVNDCIEGRNTLAYLSATRLQGLRAVNDEIVSPTIQIPSGLILNIAVISAMSRIGATTQAVAIYHYLKHVGFQPVIVTEPSFVELYRQHSPNEVKITDGHLTIKDIAFDINEQGDSEKINANIFDIGSKVSSHMNDVLSADLVVLVGGTKLNEVIAMASILPQLSNVDEDRLINIISFATEDEVQAIKDNLRGNSIAASYRPTLWEKGEIDQYNAILREKIQDIFGGYESV